MTTKKITFEKAYQRFVDQGRDDIKLIESGYNGWKKKSLFLDKELNETWMATPKSVYNQKSNHPIKAMRNRNETNLRKYGNVCSLHSEQTKKKTKSTNLEKYGKEYYQQTNDFKQKREQTYLERYNVKNISQSEEIKQKKKETVRKNLNVDHQMLSDVVKQKMKDTNLERYGKEYYSQTDEFKQQIKETSLEKYNVEHWSKTDEYKNKVKDTCLERYNATHYYKSNEYKKTLSNRWIVEENMFLYDWYRSQPSPKPSYGSVCNIFPDDTVDYQELLLFFKNYKPNKTLTEMFVERLFDIKHYNRKPKEINVLYKPDFKLSDKVYLNVDGLYWHSEMKKKKDYHFKLRKEFENSGLRIIQLYECEINKKTEIVKSIINKAIGDFKEEIKAAANCNISVISQQTASDFLNENCLKGSINKVKHIGLFYNEKLVSVLSYKEYNNICKIERICLILNTNVIGSFVRLLDYLENNCLKQNINEIHHSIDLRYEIDDNNQFYNNSFYIKNEKVNWKWADRVNVYNDKKETKEWKIYDAGQRLYIKKLNK